MFLKEHFLQCNQSQPLASLSSRLIVDLMNKNAKTIGVVFYSNLYFWKHLMGLSQTCRSCFYHISDLRWIRKSLSFSSNKPVAKLVSSKLELDYCNCLFHNIPEKYIAKLYNCTARMVTKASRFDSSVPILKQPHWLPVKFHIHFKICIATFWA